MPDAWQPAPPSLSVSSGELDVWYTRISEIEKELVRCLSKDERQRGRRFMHPLVRREFVRTRAWLRHILARYLQEPPERLRFAYGSEGKPRLADAEEGRGICFNVAHSHGVALAAVTLERPVGVDVEKVHDARDLEGLAERYFSPNEIVALQGLDRARRSRGFYLAWTRKEAFIKALGLGLAFPLDAFDVCLTPGEPAAILAVRSSRTTREQWTAIDIDLGERFTAAAIVQGQVSRVRYWHTLLE